MLFQTKKVCRRQFKFDENGRKLSIWVENTVGKGEIAHYEQFLLFPKCFQKAYFQGASKVSLCGNGLKRQFQSLTLSQTIPSFHEFHEEGYWTN